MRKQRTPERARTITTYEEFGAHIRAWVAGNLGSVIVVGDPGLAKGSTIRSELKAAGVEACDIQGRITPFRLHQRVFENMQRCQLTGDQELILLDDIDDIWRNTRVVNQLKCLCQTDEEKTMMWETASRMLDSDGDVIPRSYTTRAKTLIVVNEWDTSNINVKAIEDRSHVWVFKPTAAEVYRKAGEWFWDQVIYDFFWEHLGVISAPSMREYILANEEKKSGLDWRSSLYDCWGIDQDLLLIYILQLEGAFSTQGELVKAWMKETKKCQATFYNLKKNVPEKPEIERIVLKNTSPADASVPLDLLTLLKQRHGRVGNG